MKNVVKLSGLYGEAKIFADIVDETTTQQILDLLNTNVTENSKIRIMPDCHAGAGCVIGTTMTLKDRVCPNLVGVDIGCGMLIVNLKLKYKDIDFKKFDEACHTVPYGMMAYENTPDSWKILNIEPFEYLHKLLCFDKLNDVTHIINSLGTLGGGNHFIELDKDESDNVYLVIHSGSRNLGLQVAKYYQSIAINNLEERYLQFNAKKEKLITDYKALGKQKEIQYALTDLTKKMELMKKSITNNMKQLSCIEGNEMADYFHDVKICQEYAKINRRGIVKQILKTYFNKDISFLDDKLFCDGKEYEYFETIHNYIDFDNMILRKGSVSAQKNEKLIIPMNMRDGSLICIGKGNPEYNFSAPHGAGRIMSRIQAKENVSLKEFEDSMKGIYSTTVVAETIDESPMAYKPMQSIIDNITETVEVLTIIKPIYNFKASE